jgi:chromosome segregation ATPase
MNKDLSFQRTLIDLLKKKNLIEEKEKQEKQVNDKTEKSEVNITNEEKVKLDEVLKSNVEQINKPLVRVNTTAIEEIFSENIDLIAQEIEKFENLRGDESIDRIKLFVKEKERLENNIINLNSQIKEYENDLSTMQENLEITNRETKEAKEEIQKLTDIFKDNVI